MPSRGPGSRSTCAANGRRRRWSRCRLWREGQKNRTGEVGGGRRRLMRIGILTISDLGVIGQRADTSGDAILAWAGARGYEVAVRSVVPDETDRIAGKLVRDRKS